MKEALNLHQLKSLLAVSNEKAVLQFKKYQLEIPQGAITCLTGLGKTEFVLDFLSEQSDFSVAWIEEKFSFYPQAVAQKNLSAQNFLFLEASDQAIYTALQAIKAQVFQCVVLYKEDLELKDLRRLQLFSEKSRCVLFWLTQNIQNKWPIALELKIEMSPDTVVHPVHRRFSR